MKSIKEKAKAYDEAKYIMNEYLESGNAGVIAENTIKKAFPELSELEDEKIRKRLLEYFKSFTSETFFNGIPTNDAIAWLEKQGEQQLNGTFINADDVREEFMQEVYRILDADATNDRANQIIDAFDNLPTVAIEKQGGQKSVEWSTDDLSEFESYLCLMFQKFRTKGVCTNGEIVDFVKEHSQKLKDTLCHAWSKEDEYYRNIILYILNNECVGKTDKENAINWLKSIRHQSQWRPSESDILLLERIANGKSNPQDFQASLYGLIGQLKRLKEK